MLIEDSPDIPPFDVAALAAKYSLDGWNFVPFVTEELNLICGLDILFLRPSAPGQLVSGGDLDNRLKTLFDALRIPEASERYADRVPDDPDEKPARCLCHDGLFAHLTHSLRGRRRVVKHDARFIGIGAADILHMKFGSFRALDITCGTGLPLDRYSQCYRAVHRQPQKADMTLLSELLEDGRAVPVIDRRYDLDGVPEAPQYVEHGHARAKVAVRIS